MWMDVSQGRDFLASNTEALGTLTVILPRDSSAGIGQRRGADHGRNGATSGAFPLVPHTHGGPRDSSFTSLHHEHHHFWSVAPRLCQSSQSLCFPSPPHCRCSPHTK